MPRPYRGLAVTLASSLEGDCVVAVVLLMDWISGKLRGRTKGGWEEDGWLPV